MSGFQEIADACVVITKSFKKGEFTKKEIEFLRDWFKGFWNLSYAKLQRIEKDEKNIKKAAKYAITNNN